MSPLLVAAGALLLWPVLVTRHGRGIAVATLVALVFATVVYGLARDPSWAGATAFALAAAVVRLVWGHGLADEPRGSTRRILWIGAVAIAAVVLAAGAAGFDDVLDGLFSSSSGLLFWSPVLWLGILGSLRERHPGPSAALGPALLVAAVLGAITVDSGPFRGARFAPVLPLLALGLARALDGIRTIALHRPLLPVALGIAALVVWNALLMGQYKDGRIPRDDTVAFPRIAGNAAATVSAAAGSPTAWPANWIFATRHGVSATRYDLLAGVDLFGPLPPGGPRRDRLERGGVVDVGHLPTDEALLQGGWSVRHPCGDGVCRAVLGSADLVIPIRDPRDVDVVVIAEGTGTLDLAINGAPVLEAPLAGMRAHSVRLPRARFRRGLNAIVFTMAPGGRALVDRIVFTPARADGGASGGPEDPPFK